MGLVSLTGVMACAPSSARTNAPSAGHDHEKRSTPRDLASPWHTREGGTIRVTGEAGKEVKLDRLDLYFVVLCESQPSSSGSGSGSGSGATACATREQLVRRALSNAGVEPSEVELQIEEEEVPGPSVSPSPRGDRVGPPVPPPGTGTSTWRIRGTVKLKDRTRGEALGSAIERLEGLVPEHTAVCSELADRHALRDELRALAVRDARQQAVALASATDHELGEVLVLETSDWSPFGTSDCRNGSVKFVMSGLLSSSPAPSRWISASVKVEYRVGEKRSAVP